jgi:site-specific DNA-methyltransferase (adenine-specific)
MNRIVNIKRTDESNKTDYETPDWLFKPLDDEFHFDIDCAANKENAKCDLYLTKRDNALDLRWWKIGGYFCDNFKMTCWLNPPYSRDIGKWMKKAYQESLKGCIVVCLISVSTSTKWWHEWVLKAYEIRFIKGRIKFIGGKGTPSFDSCIVVFDENRKIIWDKGRLKHTWSPCIEWVDYKQNKAC